MIKNMSEIFDFKILPNGDAFVDVDDIAVVLQQIDDVRESRWNPATTLIEEFVETFGSERQGVRCRAVFDSEQLIYHERI